MTTAFEAKYPNVKVSTLEWTYEAAHQKYLTRIQAGNPPAAGYEYLSDVGVFKDMGALVPFGDYVPAEFLQKFYDSNLKPVTVSGKVWAMPLWFSVRMLVYNKDWLQSAGFTAQDLSNTDSFMKVMKAVYSPPNKYALAIAGSNFKNTVENFLEIFWPMGGQLLKYDSSGKAIGAAFNNPTGVQALEYYGELAKMAQPGVLNAVQADAWRAFWSKKAFGTIDQPKVVGYIRDNNVDLNWGVVIPPKGSGPEGRQATLGVEDVGFLFKTTKAQEQAGANWLMWIKDPEYSFEVNKSKNFIPLTKAVAQNSYYQQGGEGDWLGLFSAGAPYAVFRPTVAQWPQVENALITAIQKVITGGATAKQALDAAAAVVDPLFK